MYPVGSGTEEDFKKRWYIAFGFGEKTDYGYHEGLDINLRTVGDTDLGEPILAIADYKLKYYHLNSHLESGFGVHYVYEVDTPKGKRWVHCAHNQENPLISSKKEGKAGEIISHIGKTGRPRGSLAAHLHLSVFRVDPVTLPNKIDTIAKTTQQLNDWWVSPIEIIESLKKDTSMPDYFNILLQEKGLSLDREGEFRSFWEKAIKYDDEIAELKAQIVSVNEALADRSREVAILTEKNQSLTDLVTEAEETLNKVKSERDQANWDAAKLEAQVKTLDEEIQKLSEKIARLEKSNSLKAYTWFERLFSLFWR